MSVLNRVWAPELHFINGKWYIYFAADNGDNKNHRMHVLESATQDAMGAYNFVGTLDTEGWAMYAILVILIFLLSIVFNKCLFHYVIKSFDNCLKIYFLKRWDSNEVSQQTLLCVVGLDRIERWLSSTHIHC